MRILLLLICSLVLAAPARAVVGPAGEESPLRRHVVMVLSRHGAEQAFCSGALIAADIVLTAAHCVQSVADTAVLARDKAGRDVLLKVASVATHPEFRADAIRTRQRSIDIALLRLQEAPPLFLAPAALSSGADIQAGDRFRLAGFGLTREGVGKTAGGFRWGVVAAREPLSQILLWADDPQHRGLGACTGDSGGPIFSDDDESIVAVIAWTTGEHGLHCGALTQGALVAPQRSWIDNVVRGWNAR